MKQFYEIYQANEKLATLCRELSWSHNRIIFARCKSDDERQYYLDTCIKERYSVRDLERQINTSAFERTKIAQTKLSPVMRELPQDISGTFKDTYIFEWLAAREDVRDLYSPKRLDFECSSYGSFTFCLPDISQFLDYVLLSAAVLHMLLWVF